MPSTEELFDKELKDVHLIYDYDVTTEEGKHEKWKYEMWFFSFTRIIYKIHGGPMAGRSNYQTATYQCVRPSEIWQCNWLEETGTICSLIYDAPNKKISTVLGFSKGHWEHAEEAHGDKRNEEDFERWRRLADIGNQADRKMLSEQADVKEVFRGKGELEPIEENWPTL